MKLITILFSVYIIALSCLPCADVEVNSLAHASSDHKTEKENHSHDKENDLCSPFCDCNCCGPQVLTHFAEVAFAFDTITVLIKSPIPTYKSIIASNFCGSIWQPPKIV